MMIKEFTTNKVFKEDKINNIYRFIKGLLLFIIVDLLMLYSGSYLALNVLAVIVSFFFIWHHYKINIIDFNNRIISKIYINNHFIEFELPNRKIIKASDKVILNKFSFHMKTYSGLIYKGENNKEIYLIPQYFDEYNSIVDLMRLTGKLEEPST